MKRRRRPPLHSDHSEDSRERLTRNLARVEAQLRIAHQHDDEIRRRMADEQDRLSSHLESTATADDATAELGLHGPEDLRERRHALLRRRSLALIGSQDAAL